jgi:hypothetical protein
MVGGGGLRLFIKGSGGLMGIMGIFGGLIGITGIFGGLIGLIGILGGFWWWCPPCPPGRIKTGLGGPRMKRGP